MNSLFHGVSSSVATLKPFNEKPYFPPKPSFFNNPSFFFQRFSQKAHLSFSRTTANRSKPIEKTRTWCCNGGERGWTLGEEWMEFQSRGILDHSLDDDGDNYKIASSYGMETRYSKVDFAIESGIEEANVADLGVDVVAINVNNMIAIGAKPSTLRLYYSDTFDDVGLLEKVFKGVEDA